VPFDRARQCGWDGLLFVQFGLLQVESCPIFDPELYEKMNRQRVIQGKNENNNTGTLLDLDHYNRIGLSTRSKNCGRRKNCN
jgi:hypothetical protein